MDKIDFKKKYSCYRAKAGVFEIIEVPNLQYLMIDGHGDPNNDPAFAKSVSTLYPVAYKLKFMSKAVGKDYIVPPLEGLWWAKDMSAFTLGNKSDWDWTVMVMTPEWITPEMFEQAVDATKVKGGAPLLDKIRLEILAEGTCVQTLHIGPYDAEAETLAKIHHDFIPAQGLRMTQKHHEIYLNDMRKVSPDKLKTILRQPVIRVDQP